MQSSLNIVPESAVDMVWQELRPAILKALKHGQGDEHTEESMKAEIKAGRMLFWVTRNASDIVAGMVLRVVDHPNKRSVFIELLAGRNMAAWFDEHYSTLEKFRDLNKADTIEASCRVGLASILEKRGWTKKAIVMEAPNGRR